MKQFIVKSKQKQDYVILGCVAFLILFGLLMLASASLNFGKDKLDDNYFYIRHQFLYGVLLGVIFFLITSRLYYGVYEHLAMPLLALAIILLALVYTPLGVRAGGALRWLTIGPFTFQPAEFLKLATVIYFAAWLSHDRERQNNFWRGFVPFILVLGIIGAFLLSQSSTSMFAIIMLTALIVYFVSGAKLSYLFGTAILGIVLILGVSILSPYRWNRIMAYVNPETNLQSSGYHINQALMAIGTGGFKGVGYGQSTTKVGYLPEPIGDSIFAVIAEEFGFLGSLIVIFSFVILVTRIFILSLHTEHKFGQLLLVGFGSILGIQAFVNIAAISGLIPLTGIPLPFISYGSTGMIVMLGMLGITMNISSYSRNV